MIPLTGRRPLETPKRNLSVHLHHGASIIYLFFHFLCNLLFLTFHTKGILCENAIELYLYIDIWQYLAVSDRVSQCVSCLFSHHHSLRCFWLNKLIMFSVTINYKVNENRNLAEKIHSKFRSWWCFCAHPVQRYHLIYTPTSYEETKNSSGASTQGLSIL